MALPYYIALCARLHFDWWNKFVYVVVMDEKAIEKEVGTSLLTILDIILKGFSHNSMSKRTLYYT